MQRSVFAPTSAVFLIISAFHRKDDPAKIQGTNNCAALNKARITGGRVSIRDGVFIGSIYQTGGGTLYEVQCGYRLYGIAYANGKIQSQLMAALPMKQLTQRVPPKFYLSGEGSAIFYRGSTLHVFVLEKIIAVAPIDRNQTTNIFKELKDLKRIRPNRLDF